jgi:hypothetical protein
MTGTGTCPDLRPALKVNGVVWQWKVYADTQLRSIGSIARLPDGLFRPVVGFGRECRHLRPCQSLESAAAAVRAASTPIKDVVA